MNRMGTLVEKELLSITNTEADGLINHILTQMGCFLFGFYKLRFLEVHCFSEAVLSF